MEKFTKKNGEKYVKTSDEAQIAQFGHLNAIIENTPGYKVYTAAIGESLSNFVAQTFQNTIDPKGEAVWTKVNIGEYVLTFPSLPVFNGAKIWIQGMGNAYGFNSFFIPIADQGVYTFSPVPYYNSSPPDTPSYWESRSLKFFSYTDTYTPLDLHYLLNSGNLPIVNNLYIEVRLYP